MGKKENGGKMENIEDEYGSAWKRRKRKEGKKEKKRKTRRDGETVDERRERNV